MSVVQAFLEDKARALAIRARRLSRLTPEAVGIREQDRAFAPSADHFAGANRRLAAIDRDVAKQLTQLRRVLQSGRSETDATLSSMALLEREIDRARRAYGLFFELFSQRGTRFAPALAACDQIAVSCFQAVRETLPELLRGPLLKPLTYLEHSFSPATFRRGVVLTRLLGEQNPFPIIRIPFDQVESPWGMGVLLHEVGHNLQADLGIWQETQSAVQRRVGQLTQHPWLARIWTRWHKEIFADLAAILLGGPAAALSMKDFLAYPASRVLSFRVLSVHPLPYLRVSLLAAMVERLGFAKESQLLREVWRALYEKHASQGLPRAPRVLLTTAEQIIPHVVDEIAFQPRRGLAQRALIDVIRFTPADERRIREGAALLRRQTIPASLPARHLVSACYYALGYPDAQHRWMSRHVLRALAERNMQRPIVPQESLPNVALQA